MSNKIGCEMGDQLRAIAPVMGSGPTTFGWGGGAVRDAYEEFGRMKLEVFEPGVQVLYRPSPEDETKCYEFGQEFARKVKEYHENF